MTPRAWLLLRAHRYWANEQPLPSSLFLDMHRLGMDIDRERKLYLALLG